MMRRFLVNTFLRLFMKSLWQPLPSVAQVRRRFSWLDQLGSFGRRAPAVQEEQVDDIRIDWIGATANNRQGVILYMPGGAFVGRAPRTDRLFCADLARRTGMAVGYVAYRLAPEFPFPAGLDDCCRVYTALQERGIAAERIVMVGHSAGATLVLGLLMRMRQRGVAQPAGAILLSPCTDFTGASPSATSNAKRDVMLTPGVWSWIRQHYLGDAHADDPRVSPLFGDWSALAPLHFHASDSEVAFDDSCRAVKRACAAGTDADMTIWRGVPHSFAFIDLLPEAAQCRAQITQFAAHVLGRARSQARGAVAVTAEP
jgi:monoterpene epsilon-lactone hydrolase